MKAIVLLGTAHSPGWPRGTGSGAGAGLEDEALAVGDKGAIPLIIPHTAI